MTVGLEECHIELVESIVRHLEVTDIGSLRLTSRCLRSKASQGHFRSYFRSKRVKVSSPHLEYFEVVTRRDSLGCEIRDLTLVGVVRDTKSIEALETCPEDVKSKRHLQILQERQHDYEQSKDSGSIICRLSDAFNNIVANSTSGKLHSLSLEVAQNRIDAYRESPAIGTDSWQPIWQTAAETFRIVFSALQTCRLQLDYLNLFNGSHLHRCSIASNELSSIDYSSNALSQTLGSVRSLSISVSDRILDITQASSGWADESDWSGSDDEEDEEEPDVEALMTNAREEDNFRGMAGLINACQNLKILHIHQYGVNRRRLDSRVAVPSELIFQRGIAILDTLPPIEDCSLCGVFLRESDMLAFLDRSSKNLRALIMKTVTMVTGSFRPVFDYITSRILNLDYLYLDDLMVGEEPVHFTGVGQPNFLTWVGAHGSNTLRRAGKEEAQRPVPYHLPTGASQPVGSPEMRKWLQEQRREFGPP